MKLTYLMYMQYICNAMRFEAMAKQLTTHGQILTCKCPTHANIHATQVPMQGNMNAMHYLRIRRFLDLCLTRPSMYQTRTGLVLD